MMIQSQTYLILLSVLTVLNLIFLTISVTLWIVHIFIYKKVTTMLERVEDVLDWIKISLKPKESQNGG